MPWFWPWELLSSSCVCMRWRRRYKRSRMQFLKCQIKFFWRKTFEGNLFLFFEIKWANSRKRNYKMFFKVNFREKVSVFLKPFLPKYPRYLSFFLSFLYELIHKLNWSSYNIFSIFNNTKKSLQLCVFTLFYIFLILLKKYYNIVQNTIMQYFSILCHGVFLVLMKIL